MDILEIGPPTDTVVPNTHPYIILAALDFVRLKIEPDRMTPALAALRRCRASWVAIGLIAPDIARQATRDTPKRLRTRLLDPAATPIRTVERAQ